MSEIYYKIENSMVIYWTDNMIQPIIFGSEFFADTSNETNSTIIYEVKKFNIETEKYEHSNEKTEFEIDGKIVPVVGGFATVDKPEPTTPPEPEQPTVQPTESELTIMAALAENYEQQAKTQENQLAVMAALAELYERQNGGWTNA